MMMDSRIHLAMENQIYVQMIYLVQVLVFHLCVQQTCMASDLRVLHKPMMIDSNKHLIMENQIYVQIVFLFQMKVLVCT